MQTSLQFRLLIFLIGLLAVLALRGLKGLDGLSLFDKGDKPGEVLRASPRERAPESGLQKGELHREP
jgi:hypothetical protein